MSIPTEFLQSDPELPRSDLPSEPMKRFFDTRYKDYAKYVLYLRAIPNVIDGLKPSQRKGLYTGTKVARGLIRTNALAGATIQMANYHHGDGSLSGAVSQMAADWSNNLPLFHGEGEFGSRLVNTAAAPRYTHVKLHKNFERWFTDFDVMEPSLDPEDPEPKFYLPLIPWVLVNGVSGIAIGFATEIQPRNPARLSELCEAWLAGKLTDEQLCAAPIEPWYAGFKGTIFRNDQDQWVCRGVFNRTSRTQVEVVELPPEYDREKYVEQLDKLEESDKIVSYKDLSRGGFRFLIRLPNSMKDTPDEELYRFLRMERVLSENITVITELGQVKKFASPGELVLHFLRYRLAVYARRFAHWISRDSAEKALLEVKRSFIQAVVSRQIELVDPQTGRAKKEADLRAVIEGSWPGHSQMLLGIRVTDLTEESLTKLDAQIGILGRNIEEWKTADHSKWFRDELREARSAK